MYKIIQFLPAMIFIGVFTACVTPDQKASMVNAEAISDLSCYSGDVAVREVAKDRYRAACKRRQAMYLVNCPGGPKSCKIKRLR